MMTRMRDAEPSWKRWAPARARRGLRLFRDGVLSPIGSIHGALKPTSSVALTFDDGPDPDVTPRLLDLLAQRGAAATFFVLTDKAVNRQALVRRMLSEGHEVALHFDRHDRIPALPSDEARTRLSAAKAQLEAIAGPITYFRPPYGAQSLRTYFIARAAGLQVVSWGLVAEDWKEQPPETAAARAVEKMSGGDILLLHDAVEDAEGGVAPTFDRVRMVELILDDMDDKGLSATTVGRLVAAGRAHRSPWFTP